MQYALRYEDFSDVGGTVNWKVAGNYSLTDDTSLRAAISTGFHAPTPGQSNVRTTITTFDGVTGRQVEEGLIPATDPRATAAGGQKIKEEESTNFSIGISSNLGDDTTVTLDFYKIAVDDRIYRTGDIAQADGSSISFYTNAIDVEHSGLDLVISSEFDWNNSVSTDVSFAYGYNEIEVVGQRMISGVQPVSDSTVEDIENNFPNSRFVLTTNTQFSDDWSLMVRANYYGSHYDERGTIGAAENPSAEIDAIVYMDAQLNYQVNDAMKVKLGFSNIFDSFIGEVDAPNANRQSVGLQYPRRSAANYEGGSWYLGVSYGF
jgi:iron complex outermembrane receptor protein